MLRILVDLLYNNPTYTLKFFPKQKFSQQFMDIFLVLYIIWNTTHTCENKKIFTIKNKIFLMFLIGNIKNFILENTSYETC